jgi:hypothetical protein
MSPRLKVACLLFFFALCGAAVLITELHRRETATPGPRELYSIVSRQLTALRADDFESAYRQAASGVQQKFSPEQFGEMIRRDFHFMTEAQAIEFGNVEVSGGSALVQVYLESPDGLTRCYVFSFTAEDGAWKIDGVQPIGPQPVRRLPGLHI